MAKFFVMGADRLDVFTADGEQAAEYAAINEWGISGDDRLSVTAFPFDAEHANLFAYDMEDDKWLAA